MRARAASPLAAAALLALIGFSTAGCGDSSQARANHDADVIQCRLNAFQRAEFPIIRSEFNAGRLGTVKEAKAWIKSTAGKGAPVSKARLEKLYFFDSDGKILPWARMTFAQKVAFDDWTNSSQVQSRLHDRLASLFEHVRNTAKC